MIPLLGVVASEQQHLTRTARGAKSAGWPRPRNLASLTLAFLAFLSMWFYMKRVLIPSQISSAASEERPRGNLSDLYPRWLGARELLLHGRDPYSAEITREIQIGYYGRPLDPSRPHDPKDQTAFAYPVYVSFLLAPMLRQDFHLVRTGFTWMLIALLLVSVPLWLKSLAWRVPPSGALTACLLLLGSFGAAQGIKLQQLTLLVAAILAAAAAAITTRRLTLAGVLLAISTIKPQLSVVLGAWFLLWAVSDWRKRWPLLVSFAVTISVLLVGSEVALHGWIPKFLVALKAYIQYTDAASVLTNLLGAVTGLLLTAILLLLLARVAWRFRYIPANSREFGLITVLPLAVTMLIIPTIAAYNQVLLFPAILPAAQA